MRGNESRDIRSGANLRQPLKFESCMANPT